MRVLPWCSSGQLLLDRMPGSLQGQARGTTIMLSIDFLTHTSLGTEGSEQLNQKAGGVEPPATTAHTATSSDHGTISTPRNARAQVLGGAILVARWGLQKWHSVIFLLNK